MNAPLAGLRVLSLAEQYPGPYATLILSDLGADVVLVERPGGDPARIYPQFFEALNRNKRSATLNFKLPAGREAFKRLVRGADVLLEGYRPGTMARLGLDYETLSAINPRLVYASISGYGQDGPYRDRTGHDISYASTAGLFFPQARDPAIPVSPVAVGDLSSGMFAVIGVQTALLARERTDRGTYIDVSMFDGLVSWMSVFVVPPMNGDPPPPLGSDPGYGIYACKDGKAISLSVAHEDWFWQPLCERMGLTDLAAIPRDERAARETELRGRLGQAFATRERAHWEQLFQGSEVPFGPVHDLGDVGHDPHVKARGLFTRVPTPAGERWFTRQPLGLRGYETAPTRGCPALGEHTREVLREGGFTPAEVDALLADGAASGAAPA
ncbi:MAG: CoA transferase [Candidatus Lambdaproteobacteria bacterium]|nr:CoA transferase [Candidatus Lambdaproteobacteria bacterium]